MDDTISKRLAIDALCDNCDNVKAVCAHYPCKQYIAIEQLPTAESERKAPISYKEQLSLNCSFCRSHECGDKLYESSDWDGGIGFDYIRDIRFCPICGRELYGGE